MVKENGILSLAKLWKSLDASGKVVFVFLLLIFLGNNGGGIVQKITGLNIFTTPVSGQYVTKEEFNTTMNKHWHYEDSTRWDESITRREGFTRLDTMESRQARYQDEQRKNWRKLFKQLKMDIDYWGDSQSK